MERKYFYVQGMCEAIHYSSYNPVLYESSDVGQPFLRIGMDCRAIAKGICQNSDACPLYKTAPEQLEYEDWHLTSQKA